MIKEAASPVSRWQTTSNGEGSMEVRMTDGVVYKIHMPAGSSRKEWEDKFDLIVWAVSRP